MELRPRVLDRPQPVKELGGSREVALAKAHPIYPERTS